MSRVRRHQALPGGLSFSERLASHLQRLGLDRRHAARAIGCSVAALDDAVAGRAVTAAEVARLYAWVAYEDRCHVPVRVVLPDLEPLP